MPNSFGNDKSFMMTDYQPGGAMDKTDDFDSHVKKQRNKGCTCRWQLRNLTDIERRENPRWAECPVHGI